MVDQIFKIEKNTLLAKLVKEEGQILYMEFSFNDIGIFVKEYTAPFAKIEETLSKEIDVNKITGEDLFDDEEFVETDIAINYMGEKYDDEYDYESIPSYHKEFIFNTFLGGDLNLYISKAKTGGEEYMIKDIIEFYQSEEMSKYVI